jgi:aspartate/methionine/tyrosine aminotransferase
MHINTFKLEEYLSRYEFSAPYLLCCSDVESYSMQEIIHMANDHHQQLWDELRLGYTEAPGHPLLKEQIKNSLYPSLESSNILCFAGAEDGIFCSLFALCEPDDHVIVLTPCYQSLIEIPRLKGAHVTSINLRESNDWRIDLNDIKHAIRHNTKCIIINFPHNPTGQVINQDEMNELVKLCDQHGIWIFSDEVYRLLGNPKKNWASPVAEIYPRSITVGVMSKAFGMAGLRVGWIACQDKELLKKIEYVKHYTSICNSAPSEILSLIALDNKEFILKRNNEIVSHNLNQLRTFFDSFHHHFEWVEPQGGCVGFVHYKSNEKVDDFCKRLVDETGVLLMPSSIYDYKSNHFRIGFGRSNMTIALKKLIQFLS